MYFVTTSLQQVLCAMTPESCPRTYSHRHQSSCALVCVILCVYVYIRERVCACERERKRRMCVCALVSKTQKENRNSQLTAFSTFCFCPGKQHFSHLSACSYTKSCALEILNDLVLINKLATTFKSLVKDNSDTANVTKVFHLHM